MKRKAYPSDVSDEEWALIAPYLTLMSEVFNGLRWMIRIGAPWRMIPHDFAAWREIMNACRKHWQGCIFWHLPC